MIIVGKPLTKKEIQLMSHIDLLKSLCTGCWCYYEKPLKGLRKELIWLVKEIANRCGSQLAKNQAEKIVDEMGY